MKKILILIISSIIIAGFVSCSPISETLNTTVKSIPTGLGPEDIVIDTSAGFSRLLISCSSRRENANPYGEIESYCPESREHFVLNRLGEPDKLVFHPHGIDIVTISGKTYLYVISHNDELNSHPVIRYKIDHDSLIFDHLFSSTLLNSPNAVTAFEDGSFLVCNDARKRGSKLEQILGLKTGNIVFFNVQGVGTVVADKLGMPAGLNHLGNNVFVSAATGNRIYEYHFENSTLSNKRVFAKVKGPDNIRFSANNLIVAAHIKPLKFVRHVANAKNPSPTTIYQISIKDNSSEVIFSDDGEVISAGSVAVGLNSHIYIGQIFEAFIIRF